MPPVSKKDASVILYDLNTKCKDACKQALMKIACQQFFTESKGLTKLILYNSSVTRNRLEAHYGGFENIYETSESVMNYNPQIMLDMVENIEPSDGNNWVEALKVATKCLVEDYQDIKGIITLQLLVISDFTVPPPDIDNDTVQEIVDGLNSVEAFLYFIGPDIDVPFTIRTPASVKSWMHHLKIDKTNKNLTTIKDIISQTPNSVVCDLRIGVNLFFSYKNFGGSQAWKVPLAVGTSIEIPADTMKLLNEGMECKLVAESGDPRTLWISAEDESIEVDAADVVHGVSRHEKFVEVSDNKMFQAENPRGFNIVCFTKSSNVPEYIMTGDGCYCVYPSESSASIEAMGVLVDCLSKQDKYVIARRVYNNNSVPRLVVLIPKPDHKPKEKNAKSAPKIESISPEIYDFLNSIDTDNVNCENKMPLSIMMMQDVNCEKLISKAADKRFEKHLQINDVELDYLTPKALSISGEKLKNMWPEREFIQKKDVKAEGESGDEEFEW